MRRSAASIRTGTDQVIDYLPLVLAGRGETLHRDHLNQIWQEAVMLCLGGHDGEEEAATSPKEGSKQATAAMDINDCNLAGHRR